MAKSAFDLIEDDLLVEEVSKNHVLYDSSHEKHKDLHFKDTVWNRIAPVVGRNTEDCKKRWRNIRDTYMRHRKKPGIGSLATSKKKWALAKKLSFLNNVLQCEKNITTNANENVPLIEYNSEDDDDEFKNNTMEIKTEEPNFNEFQPPKKISKNTNYQTDRTAAIVESLHKQNEAILKYNKTAAAVDEIDLFFQSIAGMVKKLPPRGVSEARLEVLKTVSELEEKYSSSNSYSKHCK